ncbi:hypothetical protein GS597_19770 [Synechococcales cyanobacterium C]|uniref:Uncharacterized protein n=1 Tax=Petrachloros mirabilis ULC683 TaxID=2781853 RepID=A0A8K2A1D9_9CYAN|nr:hypothetical protein [Petrachloros mirabilis]NCJ08703.1 hypothetical protein [Petrachloros mirabilis ULC683]
MLGHHEISLSYSDLQEMLAELQQQMDVNYRSEGDEISWSLEQPFVNWFSRSVHLRDDLNLSITEWDVKETFKLIVDAQLQPLVGFSFCVAGKFRSTVRGSETDLIAHAGETQSGWLQGEVKTISEVAAGQTVSLIQLSVNSRLLEALIEE